MSNKIFGIDPGSLINEVAPNPTGSSGGTDRVAAFVQENLPIAMEVSKRIGASPELILGQWGLETGWGKSVIPGTNNLGNIKDPSGRGPRAFDKAEGSNDSYRAFGTKDDFGNGFADLMGLDRYKGAIGAGSDPGKYFTGLKNGGYATDPDYIQKGVAAAKMVAGALGSSLDAGAQAAPIGGGEYYTPKNKGRHAGVSAGADGAKLSDYFKELAASAIDAVGSGVQFVGEGAAAVANEVTDSEDYVGKNILKPVSESVRGSMSEGGKLARQSSAIEGDFLDVLQGDTSSVKLPESGEGWGMLFASGLGSLATVLIPYVGQIGKAAKINGALEVAKAANDVAKVAQLTKELAQVNRIAQGIGAVTNAAVTGGAAAEDVRQGLGQSMAQMSHDELLKSVPAYAKAYAETGDQKRARDAVVNSSARWAALASSAAGAATGALDAKVIQDVILKKGAANALAGSANSTAGRGAVGFALGSAFEGSQEVSEKVGQNIGENVGLGRDALEDATRNTLGDFLGGAVVGGPLGAGAGAISRPASGPAVNPAVEAARQQAANGNSPLSSAAVAGNDAAPAPQPEQANADPMADRLGALEAEIRQGGLLNAVRSSDSPIDSKQFVNDLSIARSPSTSPHLREQALARIEFAVEWARENAPTAPAGTDTGAAVQAIDAALSDTGIQMSERDRATLADLRSMIAVGNMGAQAKAALAQQAMSLIGPYRAGAMEAVANDAPAALLGEQQAQQDPSQRPGGALLNGLGRNAIQPTVGTTEQGQAASQEAEARLQQLAEEDGQAGTANGSIKAAPAVAPEVAASSATEAANARLGQLEQEESVNQFEADTKPVAQAEPEPEQTPAEPAFDRITEPRVAIPADDGSGVPAARRKRRAVLDSLAGLGFDRVERRDDGFYFLNPRTRQEFKLDGMADAQMANVAARRALDAAAQKAATSNQNDTPQPSEAQAKAGKYAKGNLKFDGLDIAVENPVGSTRSGTDPDGNKWSVDMSAHYGFVRRTMGADGDQVDVYIAQNAKAGAPVFVVDQHNDDGSFDEHKVVLGARTQAEAERIYDAHFSDGSGPARRRGIKTMTMDEFKSWLKSDGTKAPAAVEDVAATVDPVYAPGTPVYSDGERTMVAADESKFPDKASPSTKAKGRSRVTKGQAALLRSIAAVFGKRVVFFTGSLDDGFVLNSKPDTVFINQETGVSSLAVLGHELLHLLKTDMPQAYAAIAKVIRSRVANAKAFREDYYGKFIVVDGRGMSVGAFHRQADANKALAALGGNGSIKEQAGVELNDNELEELTADLNGNLMRDGKFWNEVFQQIQSDGNAPASLISRFVGLVTNVISRISDAFAGQRSFEANKFVNDLKEIRKALSQGMSLYAKSAETSANKLKADAMKAATKVKMSTGRTASESPAVGIHFSKQARESLDGAKYGTGMKGVEAQRLSGATDPRIKERVYAYIDNGSGVRPEDNVGGIAHEVKLPKLYDAKADVDGLWNASDLNGSESRVLDAGYDGYFVNDKAATQGVAVVLGKASRNLAAKPLNSNVSAEPLKKGLMSQEIEAIDITRIPGAKIRSGTIVVPPQSVQAANDEFERANIAVRFSKERLPTPAEQYAEVEAKFKGTDQWMKAPNGQPTKLSERQWVHVRTDAFKSWFGDWEKFAGMQGGVWNDADGAVSKAVGENGEPLVVYHGTNTAGFMSFKRPGGSGRGDLGIFTTPEWEGAASYVTSGRARNIDAPAMPKTTSDLEDIGYEFYDTDGEFLYSDANGYTYGPFDTEAEALQNALDEYDDSNNIDTRPGVYALFINVREPAESYFEGANWDGQRANQWSVEVGDEVQYDGDGKAYFQSQDEAIDFAETFVEPEIEDADERREAAEEYVVAAQEHHETTDGVVREARLDGKDGAIIRDVMDIGSGPIAPFDPFDIFVAVDPNQLKSADFNDGTYSLDKDDIRLSKERDYKLDIEREERVKAKAVQITKPELDAINADAEKFGFDKRIVSKVVAMAKDTKRKFPPKDGWAPMTVAGITVKLDGDKKPIPGSEEPKFAIQSYGFNVPPGKSRGPATMDEALADKVANKFEQLVLDVYERAEAGDKNAQTIIAHQTWYRNVAEVLRREYGASGDLLADLLGATSPNTPVDTNWKFSIDILRRFVRGDFDAELRKFDRFVKDGGDASKYPAADKIRQVSGKLYGMNSTNAMKALLDMWRVIEPGSAPKARNFALNLIGQSNIATIDVWAARMLRRSANMVRGMDLPRIPPPAETGVTGAWNASAAGITGEFGFGASVMDRVSRSLEKRGIKVSPPDLQAIAWFVEKELWGRKGWTSKQGEGGSFEEQIDATPVERYMAGWSIQQGEKVPSEGDSSVAQARVLSTLVGDDSVIAARVLPSYGLYGGVVESSFDTEWTATKGKHDPTMAIAEIARIASENDQFDIFVSRVIAPNESNPNARPGVEIYFQSPRALDAAMPILERFTSRGQDGFTMAVDPRARIKSLGDKEFVGVRLQYVPEISMRWDEGLRETLMAPGELERVMGEKRTLLRDIAAEVSTMDGVAFASMQQYDTLVVGKENYDEYIDRATEEGRGRAGAAPWFGAPIRQGLEGAIARLRGERRQVNRGGVQGAGRAGERGGRPESGQAEDRQVQAPERGIRASQPRGEEELTPLPGAPKVPGFHGPDPRLVAVAEQYARDNGITLRRQAEYVQVDPERAKRIADAYEAMPHAPNDPKVKEAFQNLIRQTVAQYEALVDAGYKFWFIDLNKPSNAEYASTPWNAMRDIRANKEMGVFPTADGFGSGATDLDVSANPLLADTGFRWPIGGPRGKTAPVLANDLFRAVHDAFGHGLEGSGFRAQGEENAWQAHVRLFTGSAVAAITSETRGQNSWLNYGPSGESNRTAQVEDTVFADQKTGLMPEWTWTEGRVSDMAQQVKRSAERAPAFYSQLQRAIEQVPARLSTMAAPQWAQWLKANASKLGVKQDEITWSGIEDYLKLRGRDKIDSAELAAWVGANGVQIEDVLMGGPLSPNAVAQIIRDNDNLGFDTVNQAYNALKVDYKRDPSSLNVWDISETDRDAIRRALDADQSPTKYGDYTVPGGTKYRELLLTLPPKSTTHYLAENQYGGRGGPFATEAEAIDFAGSGGRVLPQSGDSGLDSRLYRSSHWDQRNILAHVRVDERTDADGKRVLFVNELQSDWGQDGRKRGFGEPGKGWSAKRDENGRWDVYSAGGEYHSTVYAGSESEAISMVAGTRGRDVVPSAPFVTKTEGWLNLALKRIAMLAVEGGYDKVAFISGKQAANLYQLSNQIDRIDYNRNGDGTYNLSAIRDGREVFAKEYVSEVELEDIVGKEIAQKMVDGEGRRPEEFDEIDRWESEDDDGGDFDYDGTQPKTLSGLDLEVGGDGMKGFYDQIVPQAISKLLPKLGGGKLTKVGINGDFNVFQEEESWWGNNVTSTLYRSEQEAREAASMPQAGFEVTDKMRDTVLSGVPLFSRERAGTDAESDVDQTKDKYNQRIEALRELVACLTK